MARSGSGAIGSAAYHGYQTEAEFQRAVIEYAELRGWLVFHFPNMLGNPVGFPDLLMFRDGECVLAELKTAKGKLSGRQAGLLAAIAGEGIEAVLWRPDDWLEIEVRLA